MSKYIKSSILPLSEESFDVCLNLAKSPDITEYQAEELSMGDNLDIQLCLSLNPNVPQSIKDKLNCPKYIIISYPNEHYGHWRDDNWAYRVCDDPEDNIVVEDGDPTYNSAEWYQEAVAISNDFEDIDGFTREEFTQKYSSLYDESVLDAIWDYMNTPVSHDAWSYNNIIIDIVRIIFPNLPLRWGVIDDVNHDGRVTVFYCADVVDFDTLEDYYLGEVSDVSLFEITSDCIDYIGEESWFWMYDNRVIDSISDELMANSEIASMTNAEIADMFHVNAEDCLFDLDI
jgi:hypothetical protein